MSEGIDVEVIDLRTLTLPLRMFDLVVASVTKTGRLVGVTRIV